MINFQYFTPTKVVFGRDTEKQTGELVKAEGCRKVLVHYGGKSAVKADCWIVSAVPLRRPA